MDGGIVLQEFAAPSLGTRPPGRTLGTRFLHPSMVARGGQANPPAHCGRPLRQAGGGPFRSPLHGLPVPLYTDALALFGHQSTTDGRDPRSEFQRALTALGVTHLVAPSPQAKGKIERRFGTFQQRLVTLLAYEKITDYALAQTLLDSELARQNRTVCRTTGFSPDQACAKAHQEQRCVLQACPDPTL